MAVEIQRSIPNLCCFLSRLSSSFFFSSSSSSFFISDGFMIMKLLIILKSREEDGRSIGLEEESALRRNLLRRR